ncbi:MAG: rhomboid family intramembrane serine protease [candidate division WOR-3 bacterium]
MLPIKDEQRHRRFPIWTVILILINIGVFAYQFFSPAGFGEFIEEWGFVPRRFFAFYDWQTVFSSMFMHANLMHIIGNMLYLWIFGDNVEDVLGKVFYPVFYVLSGVAAVFAHALLFPDSSIPLVGASGAISGVLGAYLIFFPRSRILTFTFYGGLAAIPSFVYLLFWIGFQILNAWFTSAQGGAGIAYLAHAGGFLAGLVLSLPFWIIRKAMGLYPFSPWRG